MFAPLMQTISNSIRAALWGGFAFDHYTSESVGVGTLPRNGTLFAPITPLSAILGRPNALQIPSLDADESHLNKADNKFTNKSRY